MATSPLASAIGDLFSEGLDAGANALIAHQDTIVTLLRTYADKTVDELAKDLEDAFPANSLGQRIIVGDERQTTANFAAEIKAQLDAEAPVLFNLFVNGIADLSARASGDNAT